MNTKNPHNVTAEQIGLGNVPNVPTNDQTPTYEVATNWAELKSGEKLSVAFGKIAKAVQMIMGHIATLGTKTAYGNVALSDSSAVTDTTGLALAATEKNASIDGTLANQIASKQNTITGAGTTLTTNNLPAGYALISNDSGKVSVCNVTASELWCLSGVTGNIQTQLNNAIKVGYQYFGTDSVLASGNLTVNVAEKVGIDASRFRAVIPILGGISSSGGTMNPSKHFVSVATNGNAYNIRCFNAGSANCVFYVGVIYFYV